MTRKYNKQPKETIRKVNIVKVSKVLYFRYLELKHAHLESIRKGTRFLEFDELMKICVDLFYPGLKDPDRYPFIFPPSVRTVYLGDNIDGTAGGKTRIENEKSYEMSKEEGTVEVRHPILVNSF